MSSAFGDVKTVLDFAQPTRRKGKPPPWMGWPTARFFWPSFARQILVRERRLRPLNILQEYVLKLLLAGIRSPDEIARLLMPASQAASARGPQLLVRRIFEELSRDGLIAGEQLTELGREMVEGSSTTMVELASRYVFQDPWTGTVWHRFPERLLPALIDVTLPKGGGGGTVELVRGKRKQRAFVVDPGDIQPCAIPENEAITKAFASFGFDWAMAADSEAGDAPQGIMEIIDVGREEPVYLLVTAFNQPRPGSDLAWRAADPFGLGVDDRLSDSIADWCGKPEGERFARWLARRASAKQTDSQEPEPESEPTEMEDEGE